MKPNLVIGLGNPLAGDDGIGCRIAEELAAHPGAPQDTEVIDGGTDVLRCATEMEGRTRVIIIDAMLDDSEPGTVTVFENDFEELGQVQSSAHHLSVVQAVSLLRICTPSLATVRFTLIAISVASAVLEQKLSASLSEKLPQLVQRVREELA